MEPTQLEARRISDINWESWQPVDRATLLFVVRDGEILLIHKRRGLGAGKINGPGGRLEHGETPIECALRETQEEVGVTPFGVSLRGELSFQFLDGYSLHGWVFLATGCRGEPQETAEAIPLWRPLDAIPYDQMWADDRHWLPLMLDGRRFRGRFIFDGDHMLDFAVEETPEPALATAQPIPTGC